MNRDLTEKVILCYDCGLTFEIQESEEVEKCKWCESACIIEK